MTPITHADLLCKCCGQGNPHPNLILAVNQLQDLAQRQLEIDSGCRCEKHNAAVGGERHSQHLLGRAAHLKAHGLSSLELYLLAEQVPFLCQGGIGLYPQHFIHIDVREGRARWFRNGTLQYPISAIITRRPPKKTP
jgi:zinc D-Ala-D-Ala carboxypeptidase